MSRIARKSFSLALAISVATITPVALTAGSFTPVAVAQNNQAGDAVIKGSLTIDKKLGDPGSQNAEALGGITFKVEQVKIDEPLNTSQWWAKASEIAAGDVAAAPMTGDVVEETTTSEGKAVFPELPIGMYKVTEQVNGSYTVAAPFFVTIPLNKDGGLEYNPTISPKNQLLEPKKTAEDTNVTVGENITYTITAPVPAGDVLQDGTRSLNKFTIEDELVEHLSYVDASAEVTLTGADNAALADGDYTVTYEGKTLKVDFTEQGRDKLVNLRKDNPGLAVQVKFQAKVESIPADGKQTNQANVHVPNRPDPIPSKPEGGDDDGNDNTTTRYYDVAITKTLNGQNAEGDDNGAGAQFQVFECVAQADNKYALVENAQPLKGTNADGSAAIADPTLTAEGQAPEAAVAKGYALQFDPEKEYCAVETKAPEGYLLNPDPIHLTTDNTNPAQGRVLYTATVDNVKDNIWGKLPATGERTMLIILGLGLLLFAGGATYQLRRKNA